ncbi:GT4 family glycosyltransferase PelF [Amycolatopsis aidingensis]|uniref:GT4 family glycosyltransferase PelF n=1 Tax=Amycolatopsis aidingensis TaxID=2842453 RepID=UPI001C0A9BAC|nr:GT4 family glycosyltransferase PelF [Amycolatopsis aidingensis]
MTAAETARHIAVVSESTYPFGPGGVSLWTHQLIEGMPEHSFTAVAITAHGTERVAWPVPANLAGVVNIPLWAGPPARARRVPGSFADTHRAFLRAMLAAAEPDPRLRHERGTEFLAALRGFFDYARHGDLGAALSTNDSVDRLLVAWREAGEGAPGKLTLHDAIVATDRIEHLLRPLAQPPVRADVCHLAMNGTSALVGMAAKWAHGTPIVLSEHGVYLRERYLGSAQEPVSPAVRLLLLRFFRALAAAGYRTADLLAPHSSYNRRWGIYNGAAPERVRTMYNGIDPADFPPAGAEPDEATIVFVGRIDPLKDLHTLLRAFALVRARRPGARLRMFGPVPAGNEDYHADCLRLAAELGLDGSAVFEGRVPRQADAYHAGHLVALPSVSEGFPYTVVESMCTGRPPVCTDVGGVREAVGDAGLVVPPRDHAAFAAACLRLLDDAGLRRELGARARRRVLDRFTLGRWNDAYREVYRDLLRDPVPALTGGPGTVAVD